MSDQDLLDTVMASRVRSAASNQTPLMVRVNAARANPSPANGVLYSQPEY